MRRYASRRRVSDVAYRSVCDLSRVLQDDWAKYLKEGMNVTLLTWNGKVSTTQCLGAGGRHSRGALVLQVIDVEVANSVVFLLSERSSGINGTTLVVDAGLGANTFDKEIIRLAMRMEQ